MKLRGKAAKQRSRMLARRRAKHGVRERRIEGLRAAQRFIKREIKSIGLPSIKRRFRLVLSKIERALGE